MDKYKNMNITTLKRYIAGLRLDYKKAKTENNTDQMALDKKVIAALQSIIKSKQR